LGLVIIMSGNWLTTCLECLAKINPILDQSDWGQTTWAQSGPIWSEGCSFHQSCRCIWVSVCSEGGGPDGGGAGFWRSSVPCRSTGADAFSGGIRRGRVSWLVLLLVFSSVNLV
jgi:hypothetical protein